MRVPKVITSNKTEMQEEVQNINFYIKPSMYIDLTELLEDEKKRQKFIQGVERLIRGSLEYREYITFLRTEINMNSCFFYDKIDRNEMNVALEIHHDPFTLYDLCEIVIMKRINEGEDIQPFNVAEEVMKLHFMGLVGLVPLSKTVHKLVHNGQLFVPINHVYGNLKEFIERYKTGLSPDHINLLKKAAEMSIQMEGEEYNPEILERRAVYLNVRDQESVRKIETELYQFA